MVEAPVDSKRLPYGDVSSGECQFCHQVRKFKNSLHGGFTFNEITDWRLGYPEKFREPPFGSQFGHDDDV